MDFKGSSVDSQEIWEVDVFQDFPMWKRYQINDNNLQMPSKHNFYSFRLNVESYYHLRGDSTL